MRAPEQRLVCALPAWLPCLPSHALPAAVDTNDDGVLNYDEFRRSSSCFAWLALLHELHELCRKVAAAAQELALAAERALACLPCPACCASALLSGGSEAAVPPQQSLPSTPCAPLALFSHILQAVQHLCAGADRIMLLLLFFTCRRLCNKYAPGLNEGEVRAALGLLDKNQDGIIQFNEFVSGFPGLGWAGCLCYSLRQGSSIGWQRAELCCAHVLVFDVRRWPGGSTSLTLRPPPPTEHFVASTEVQKA